MTLDELLTAGELLMKQRKIDAAYERSLRRDGMLPGELDDWAAAAAERHAEERHQRLERERRY